MLKLQEIFISHINRSVGIFSSYNMGIIDFFSLSHVYSNCGRKCMKKRKHRCSHPLGFSVYSANTVGALSHDHNTVIHLLFAPHASTPRARAPLHSNPTGPFMSGLAPHGRPQTIHSGKKSLSNKHARSLRGVHLKHLNMWPFLF